jgi:GTP-binding protein HflX
LALAGGHGLCKDSNMGKIYGTTAGLKSSHKKQLQNLYRRRINPAQFLLPEQARDLARLSQEMGRQIGLVINRKGGVERVIAGQPQHLPIPDMTRFRRGITRLVGYSLLHTVFGPPMVSPELQARLAVHWWDYVAVMGVEPDGLPGSISLAHLLPEAEAGQDVRHLELFRAGQAPEDLSRLVRSLEEELTRISGTHHLASSDRAILLKVSPLPRHEALEQIGELHELCLSAGIGVVDQVVQRRPKPDPRTVLGPGKLEDVLVQSLRLDANLLIFDQNLSPSRHTAWPGPPPAASASSTAPSSSWISSPKGPTPGRVSCRWRWPSSSTSPPAWAPGMTGSPA